MRFPAEKMENTCEPRRWRGLGLIKVSESVGRRKGKCAQGGRKSSESSRVPSQGRSRGSYVFSIPVLSPGSQQGRSTSSGKARGGGLGERGARSRCRFPRSRVLFDPEQLPGFLPLFPCPVAAPHTRGEQPGVFLGCRGVWLCFLLPFASQMGHLAL